MRCSVKDASAHQLTKESSKKGSDLVPTTKSKKRLKIIKLLPKIIMASTISKPGLGRKVLSKHLGCPSQVVVIVRILGVETRATRTLRQTMRKTSRSPSTLKWLWTVKHRRKKVKRRTCVGSVAQLGKKPNNSATALSLKGPRRSKPLQICSSSLKQKDLIVLEKTKSLKV